MRERKPVIPALRRWRQEDQQFKASRGYTASPYLKNKTRAGGMAKVVEHLPCTNESLSSDPSTIKKKKKKKPSKKNRHLFAMQILQQLHCVMIPVWAACIFPP
jgi:hypothetical protein